MLGAIGLFLSSLVRQLENFASVMNFVIFPMFFASSALYPLWRIRESSETLYWICELQPVQPRGPARPLRPLRPVRAGRLRRGGGRDARLLRHGGRRLRSRPRHHGPARRPGRRDHLMEPAPMNRPARRILGLAFGLASLAGPALAQPKTGSGLALRPAQGRDPEPRPVLDRARPRRRRRLGQRQRRRRTGAEDRLPPHRPVGGRTRSSTRTRASSGPTRTRRTRA